MKQSCISRQTFRAGFEEIRPDNFSRQGLNALYDYFTMLEADCDIEIEFDVIGICCEFSEYADLAEFRDNYGTEFETLDDVRDRTLVINVDQDAFIIQDF